MAKISAVLAYHPGKRYVEKASQLLILNRLAQNEIGSRITKKLAPRRSAPAEAWQEIRIWTSCAIRC